MSRLASILAVAAAALLSAPAAAQDRTIFLGAQVVQPDGKLAPNMAVIVVGGKIDRVVAADQVAATAKDTVVRLADQPGAVISPGLIDLWSAAGALNEEFERKQPVDPSLTALDAVNPGSRALGDALRAGVTSVMVMPGHNSVVAGVAGTIRTSTPGAHLDVLRAEGPMLFNLASFALTPDREPTSRAGALDLLRGALTAAKSGKGDTRLADVLNKKLDALVVCEAAGDVDAAARTFGEFSLKPNLLLGTEALDAADDMGGSGITCVLGPLTFSSSQKALLGPALLAKAGVDVALAGRTPLVEASGLRVTAALAVRYGLDPALGRLAITRNAARVAGVAERVGTLEPGKDADLVVFSADPLRLEAKVLEVYVKGARVYACPAPGSDLPWGEEPESAGGSHHVSDH